MDRPYRCSAIVLVLFMSVHGHAKADLPTTIDLAVVPPDATIEGAYPLGWGGSSVCVADINGDNWPDVVVASCLAEPLGGLRQGELTIVWGAYPGLSGTIPLSSFVGASHIYGPADGDPIYCKVASGDFNADGFDDILWGHPGSPGPEWFGKVYVIRGSSLFPDLIDLENPPSSIVAITGHDPLGFLGYGLASCDFNGDGVDDIVISASGMVNAEVYVIAGSPCLSASYWTGSNVPGMTRLVDVEQYRDTGHSIAAGDVDGDGKDDLVLGAPGNSSPTYDGRVRILHGAPGLGDSVYMNSESIRSKVVMPEFAGGQLGQDVAIGDVDNDGELDIAVSALSADPAGCDGCGAVYIIKDAAGMPDTLWLPTTTQLVTRLFGSGTSTYYGLHLVFSDFDGDHRDDLAVSNWPFQGNQRARTIIAFASALTSGTHMLALDPGFARIIEKKVGDRLGSSLSSADLNRDGLGDLLIGALAADPPAANNAGEVYLVNGCYVVSATPSVASRFSIRQNYPNPFNPATTVSYSLPQRSRVRVNVFDVTGRSIATLVDAEQEMGAHLAHWDGLDDEGREAASGVYFCRLVAGELSASIKLVLLR